MVDQYLSILLGMGLFLLIDFVILFLVRQLSTKVWKTSRRAKAAAMIFLLFGGMTALSANTFLFPPAKDYSKPFAYSYTSLGLVDNGLNLTRATELHQMLIQSGIRDPLGFLFQDFPRLNTPERTIRILPANPYYLVEYKKQGSSTQVPTQGSVQVPTLIQVPKSWLNNLTLVKQKVREFLQIPPANASRLSLYANYSSTGNEPFVNLEILLRDVHTDGAVIIFFGYLLKTGFSYIVNVEYTTIHYDINKASMIYQEVAYQDSVAANISINSLIMSFLFGALTLILPPLFLTAPKNSQIQKVFFPEDVEG